jgi:hypothetical protein
LSQAHSFGIKHSPYSNSFGIGYWMKMKTVNNLIDTPNKIYCFRIQSEATKKKNCFKILYYEFFLL